MKNLWTLKVIISILEELAFIKSKILVKFGFLDLVNFNFLDLAQSI